MNVKGKVKLIGEMQSFDSGFTKRQLVVTTDETYPQDIAIEFVKDKCSVLDNYKVGDSVDVSINIRGNEYNGKYYVSLNGWRIENVASQSNEQHSTEVDLSDNNGDKLPF